MPFLITSDGGLIGILDSFEAFLRDVSGTVPVSSFIWLMGTMLT